MGILNVMGELHHESDLKLNLKFEIEVLCRQLNVEIAVSFTKFATSKMWFIIFLFQSLKIGNVLKDQRLSERFVKEHQLSNPAKLEKPTMQPLMGPSPVPPHAGAAGGSGQGLPPPTPGGMMTPMTDEQSKLRFGGYGYSHMKSFYCWLRSDAAAECNDAYTANSEVQLPRHLRYEPCRTCSAYRRQRIGMSFRI